MTYTRILLSSKHGSPAPKMTVHTYAYNQPRWDRAKFVAYSMFYQTTLHWPMNWLEKMINSLDEWNHDRSCSNNCGTWTHVADGSKSPGCVYAPFSMKLDLWHYDLDNKNNTNVTLIASVPDTIN